MFRSALLQDSCPEIFILQFRVTVWILSIAYKVCEAVIGGPGGGGISSLEYVFLTGLDAVTISLDMVIAAYFLS